MPHIVGGYFIITSILDNFFNGWVGARMPQTTAAEIALGLLTGPHEQRLWRYSEYNEYTRF